MKCNNSYWQNKEIIEFQTSVITTRDISDGAKITLAFLMSYSDRDEISISQARVADDLAKSRQLINKHYLELERYGYIILMRVKGASSSIIFTRKAFPND